MPPVSPLQAPNPDVLIAQLQHYAVLLADIVLGHPFSVLFVFVGISLIRFLGPFVASLVALVAIAVAIKYLGG